MSFELSQTSTMSLPPLELFIASVLAGLSLETAAEDESQLSYIAALVGEEVRFMVVLAAPLQPRRLTRLRRSRSYRH